MNVRENHWSDPGSRPNHEPTRGGPLRLVFAGLLLCGLLVASTQALAATVNQWPVGKSFNSWPSAWTPINALNDGDNALTNTTLEFVGDATNPGFYIAKSANYLFFRIRVQYDATCVGCAVGVPSRR